MSTNMPTKGVAAIALRELERGLAAAKADDHDSPAAVHEARVMTKRLRALWRAARPGVSDDAYRAGNERMKRASAALAGSRDRTVLSKTLKRLRKRAKKNKHRRALDRVGGAIGAGGADAPDAAPPPQRWDTVTAELRADREQWSTIHWSQPPAAAVRQGVAQSYRSARKRGRKAVNSGRAADFHDWRKQVKFLLYQLELLAPPDGRSKKADRLIAGLKKLGARLGRLNDLAMLHQRLADLDDEQAPDKDAARAQRLIEREAARLKRRCARLRQRCLTDKPRRFEKRMVKKIAGDAPRQGVLRIEPQPKPPPEVRIAN